MTDAITINGVEYIPATSKPTSKHWPRAQSGLSREYVHGPLQGMNSDRLTVGQFIAWVGTLAGLCVLVALLAAVVS